jgi:amino acid adenylation domain-containing protein
MSSNFLCSPAQRRFWVLDQLDPHSPALNVAVRWKLEGVVVHEHLETAFQLIVARHQVLRTWFSPVEGEPVQVVEQFVNFKIPVVDLSALPEAEMREEAERIARTEARAPFDLASPPLIRVTHLRLRENVSMLLVTAHHIVCDGWSIGVLASEMGTICQFLQRGEAPQLAPLRVSYAPYSSAAPPGRQDAGLTEELAYWGERLRGVKQFELHTDHPRPPVQTSNGDILSMLLDRPLTDALTRLSRQQGCTLFMTSFAAFLTLLFRYTGETDIAVGTQFVGRDDVELENAVGLFINTLLLRNDLSGAPSFLELLERVKERVVEAYEYQHVPLEQLIELLKPKRDPSRNALFSINFIFQRSFIRNEVYGDFKLIDMPSCPAGAMYDLNVFMVERPEGWRAACEYNTDLFDTATIERLLGNFHNLLQAIVADPARPISSLSMLSQSERAHLVVDCNRTGTAYPEHLTLPALFQSQAARTPDAVAVICGSRSTTYRELDLASNRLACHLLRCNIQRGSRIGVYLKRSTELVTTLLAILKAGFTYIPLDPAYPMQRIAHVLDSARPAAVVTHSALRRSLPEIPAVVVSLDADMLPIDACPGDPLAVWPVPADLAYVIYTSGSTGKPKGVQIQHRALVNLLWAMLQRPGLAVTDTLLAVTTISFDIAALEVFLPLIVGARLVVAEEDEVVDGKALRRLIDRHRATLLQCTPATWQLLLESGWVPNTTLKMLCGGEALPRKLAETLLRGGGELWNMYGPTETTIWSSALKVESGDGAVPLGPPIANTQFYVLDGQQELLPLGVPGELYIGGDGVARGYHEQPGITAERFMADKFRSIVGAKLYRTGDIVRMRADGCFDYLGRSDQQVKLRGFRIELGEIESVLEHNPNVAEAAATVGTDPGGEPAIWAYVVPKGITAEQSFDLLGVLRSDLKQSLPAYMHPSSIVALNALPRTPNGKIDRKALPRPDQAGAKDKKLAVPLNEVEARLAAIWGSILGLSHVDRDADFVDLGGHSLLAARLLARIEADFGQSLNLGALFRAPTVAEQAKLLMRSELREYDFRQIIRLQPNGSKPPMIAINNTGVYYYNLSRYLGPDQPLTALQLFDPTLQRRNLPQSFEGIAGEYVRLIREFQPAGPYRLMGWCLGGALAFEVARQLKEQKHEVSMLVLFDTWAPGYRRRLSPLRAVLADYSYRWRLILADWSRVASRHGGVREFLAHRTLFRKVRGWFGSRSDPPAVEERADDTRRSDESYDQWLLGYLEDAVKRYEPGRFAGKVTLICSSREPRGLFLDKRMGWGAFCDEGVEVCIVEGDHFTMFQDPGVTQMAGHLTKVERGGGPPVSFALV